MCFAADPQLRNRQQSLPNHYPTIKTQRTPLYTTPRSTPVAKPIQKTEINKIWNG
jgi:hypothetical protein